MVFIYLLFFTELSFRNKRSVKKERDIPRFWIRKLIKNDLQKKKISNILFSIGISEIVARGLFSPVVYRESKLEGVVAMLVRYRGWESNGARESRRGYKSMRPERVNLGAGSDPLYSPHHIISKALPHAYSFSSLDKLEQRRFSTYPESSHTN